MKFAEKLPSATGNLSPEDQTNWPIEGGLTKDVDCKVSLGDFFSPPHIILVCENPTPKHPFFSVVSWNGWNSMLSLFQNILLMEKNPAPVDMVNVPLFLGFIHPNSGCFGISSNGRMNSFSSKSQIDPMQGRGVEFLGHHRWKEGAGILKTLMDSPLNCLFHECLEKLWSIWVCWRDASKKVGFESGNLPNWPDFGLVKCNHPLQTPEFDGIFHEDSLSLWTVLHLLVYVSIALKKKQHDHLCKTSARRWWHRRFPRHFSQEAMASRGTAWSWISPILSRHCHPSPIWRSHRFGPVFLVPGNRGVDTQVSDCKV